MKNRFRFYQEMRSGLSNISNSYFDFQKHANESESKYESAKQILMSIPDENFGERLQVVDLRIANNGSDITRWNQHRQQTQNKENQIKIKKSHKNRCRHVSSQNSFVQNQHSQFSIGHSLKKELNKLQLPLKEKNINQEQFRNSERENQRNKTRNQIKLDIINSKFELAPTMHNKKKTQTEHNYENILILKTENNNYHRIRRKGMFTIDLQTQKSHQETYIKNLSRTRQKGFFLKNQYENNPRIRQRSVNHIFACLQ